MIWPEYFNPALKMKDKFHIPLHTLIPNWNNHKSFTLQNDQILANYKVTLFQSRKTKQRRRICDNLLQQKSRHVEKKSWKVKIWSCYYSFRSITIIENTTQNFCCYVESRQSLSETFQIFDWSYNRKSMASFTFVGKFCFFEHVCCACFLDDRSALT